ncbi:putative disease resistance protein RGA1 isoform X1 [Triticum dicoccoides]|uniref:putative disease resistance protein RGA1 isoform X1 n=1 Tax=Triticum dicoccoides TaxID=85692 RepID=UPI000E78E16D|nr:putative disease resistance protein RGA1 isoform X1 [Triticum dicoccoides]
MAAAAAVVGGMVASGVIKVVIKQIGSAIGGKIKLHKNLTRDLEKMKMTLESVEAALSDAERRSITDSSALLWVNRLKAAMYDISDMLDDFESDTQSLVGSMRKKISMPDKMKKMQKRLQKITEDHQNYHLPPETRTNEPQLPDIRENAGTMVEAEIIGRAEEKLEILARLSGSTTEHTTFVPIWGLGGIGKSTLARLVYNHPEFEKHSRLWVYVSQTFDLKIIGNTIISQLSRQQSQQILDLHSINIRLQELLAEKKNALIILDDLWEKRPSQLEELKSMLKQGKGCKVMVVVTTRDEGIANAISTVRPYNLPQLSDEMCWEIMSQKSKFETRDDKEWLEPIGRDIAKKCKGVALAAQSLGHILRSKSYGEWNSVRTNHIWNLSTSTDASSSHEVLGSLLLSYNLMPPYLKLCFAYCAIFPKGHTMIKDELIHQWIALGFMEPSSIFSYWQLGESYIMQLLEMSFLQHSKAIVEWYDVDNIVTLFTMHDLVYDLARSVMADEFNLAGSNCRYAWNIDSAMPLKSSTTSPEKLRALNIVGDETSWPSWYKFHRDAIAPAKYVRVLHSSVSSNRLVASIGQLKQLRYLSAPNIRGRVDFGCIGMLQKLNYLNLHNCQELSALPETIGEMEGLMYLNLSDCQNLKELPNSFANLKELVYLNLANSDIVIGLPEALANLTKLQQLELTACENLRGRPEVITNLTELRNLRLSRCMHHIFDNSPTDQTESFIDSICRLPNMEHLDLSFNGHPLISIPESASCLRKLVLHGCRQVARLPECVAKMDCQSLFGLLPTFSVTAVDSKCYTNLGLLEHVNPDKLNIEKLENVKSREEVRSVKLMEKQRIEEFSLMWNPEAKRYVDDMELLMELMPPTTLQKFRISGYIRASFPDWVMSIGNYLPNIVQMSMFNLPNCNCLPPLSQLPNLRVLILGDMEILEEWNIALMFRKLENVTIHDCPKLRIKPHLPRAASWSIKGSDNVLISWAKSLSHNGASSSSSQVRVSTNLTVGNTEEPLHRWRLLHHLPAISDLCIHSCDDLRSSPEISWAFRSLKSLRLEFLAQSELSGWVGELSSLQLLEITRCDKLEELPDSMRQLKQLQTLAVFACDSFRQLPLWLGELTSLKKLLLLRCPAITTLPDSIEQLTNLQELAIDLCPNLEQWCEAEENKPKLAHIEQKWIDLPPKRAASRRCPPLRWPLLRTKIRKGC